MDEMLLRMVQKILNQHVFSNFASVVNISCSSDLWIFKGGLQCGHFCPNDNFFE